MFWFFRELKTKQNFEIELDSIKERLYLFSKNSYGDTPSHISNLEVKSINAESTWGAAPWEDRNLLNFFYTKKISLKLMFIGKQSA